MSLITEKDVSGYSAVHYAAMKGNIAVRNCILYKAHSLRKKKKQKLISFNDDEQFGFL